MNTDYSAAIASPLGIIGISTKEDKIVCLTFLPENTSLKKAADGFTQEIVQQLLNYFKNPKITFSIPWSLQGSAFQQTVWMALNKIPVGETFSYGALAKQLQTSPRAIGQACRTNPIPIIIPCHRIVATSHLGGYTGHRAGKMLAIKKWLLDHEKSI